MARTLKRPPSKVPGSLGSFLAEKLFLEAEEGQALGGLGGFRGRGALTGSRNLARAGTRGVS